MKWSGSTCNVNIEGLSLRNKKRPAFKKKVHLPEKVRHIQSIFQFKFFKSDSPVTKIYTLYRYPPYYFRFFRLLISRLFEFICLRANSRRGKTLCMCRRAKKKYRAKIISYIVLLKNSPLYELI